MGRTTRSYCCCCCCGGDSGFLSSHTNPRKVPASAGLEEEAKRAKRGIAKPSGCSDSTDMFEFPRGGGHQRFPQRTARHGKRRRGKETPTEQTANNSAKPSFPPHHHHHALPCEEISSRQLPIPCRPLMPELAHRPGQARRGQTRPEPGRERVSLQPAAHGTLILAGKRSGGRRLASSDARATSFKSSITLGPNPMSCSRIDTCSR